jgi:hypothetical protein
VLRAGQIQGEGSVVSGVQTKLEPLLLVHLTRTIIGNRLEMRKLQPPKVKGQKLKKTDHRTLQRLVPEQPPKVKGQKLKKTDHQTLQRLVP